VKSSGIPQFAVIGHPNEGKSSVVSTLAEDDSVRITNTPGETVSCRGFPVVVDGEEIIRFVDTPGFQSPLSSLRWLKDNEGHDMLDRFVHAHREDPAFKGECELFGPLIDGAGIIYVVDASRPLRSFDHAEMEILRMTGISRMAIINNKDEMPRYTPQWKEELRKTFNSTRVFNAHLATYAQRLGLLEALKGIDQEREASIGRVIEAFRKDWLYRNIETARIVCDMLSMCLRHKIVKDYYRDVDITRERTGLEESFKADISHMERQAQLKIKALFRHNIFDYMMPEQSMAGADLFHRQTWQVLGLKPWQIVAAGAATGSGIGLGLDAATAGITFGVFAISGALIGAVSALFSGQKAAKATIKGPMSGRFGLPGKIGGSRIIIGPISSVQLPYILLDRALIFYAHTINWAHGRRNRAGKGPDESRTRGYVSGFSEDQLQVCSGFFRSIRTLDETAYGKNKDGMTDMILGLLTEISHNEHY